MSTLPGKDHINIGMKRSIIEAFKSGRDLFNMLFGHSNGKLTVDLDPKSNTIDLASVML